MWENFVKFVSLNILDIPRIGSVPCLSIVARALTPIIYVYSRYFNVLLHNFIHSLINSIRTICVPIFAILILGICISMWASITNPWTFIQVWSSDVIINYLVLIYWIHRVVPLVPSSWWGIFKSEGLPVQPHSHNFRCPCHDAPCPWRATEVFSRFLPLNFPSGSLPFTSATLRRLYSVCLSLPTATVRGWTLEVQHTNMWIYSDTLNLFKSPVLAEQITKILNYYNGELLE